MEIAEEINFCQCSDFIENTNLEKLKKSKFFFKNLIYDLNLGFVLSNHALNLWSDLKKKLAASFELRYDWNHFDIPCNKLKWVAGGWKTELIRFNFDSVKLIKSKEEGLCTGWDDLIELARRVRVGAPCAAKVHLVLDFGQQGIGLGVLGSLPERW